MTSGFHGITCGSGARDTVKERTDGIVASASAMFLGRRALLGTFSFRPCKNIYHRGGACRAGLVRRVRFTDSPGFTQDSRKIRGWIRSRFARFATDSQIFARIRKDSQDLQDSHRFAQIREPSRGSTLESRRRYARIRMDSRLFREGSHVYARRESVKRPLLTTHCTRR